MIKNWRKEYNTFLKKYTILVNDTYNNDTYTTNKDYQFTKFIEILCFVTHRIVSC